MLTMKIETPDWLDDRAKVYFEQIIADLGKHAIPTDWSLVADYAQAQSDVVSLTDQVRFEGDVLYSDKGNAYTSPRSTVLMARRKDLERLRRDLGFTPRSRGVTVKATQKSGLASAMERGK